MMKKELQKVVKGTYMPAGESDCEPKAPCLIPRRKINSRKWAHNFVGGGIKRLQRVVWFLCQTPYEIPHRFLHRMSSNSLLTVAGYFNPSRNQDQILYVCLLSMAGAHQALSEAWFEIYIVDQEPGATGILRLCELQSVCFLILGWRGRWCLRFGAGEDSECLSPFLF